MFEKPDTVALFLAHWSVCLSVALTNVHKVSQKWETNCAPLCETTSTGKQCSLKTRLNISSAISFAKGSFFTGMKCTILENWSTTVIITVLPSEGGSPVTKSKAMWDQGQCGVGRGHSSPFLQWLDPLLRAQMEQAATYSSTSAFIEGHQNLCEAWNIVLLTPGWQDSGDECAQCINADLWSGGTNKWLHGHPSGEGLDSRARWTSSSHSHWMVPKTQIHGMMYSREALRVCNQDYEPGRGRLAWHSLIQSVRQMKMKSMLEQCPPGLSCIE